IVGGNTDDGKTAVMKLGPQLLETGILRSVRAERGSIDDEKGMASVFSQGDVAAVERGKPKRVGRNLAYRAFRHRAPCDGSCRCRQCPCEDRAAGDDVAPPSYPAADVSAVTAFLSFKSALAGTPRQRQQRHVVPVPLTDRLGTRALQGVFDRLGLTDRNVQPEQGRRNG